MKKNNLPTYQLALVDIIVHYIKGNIFFLIKWGDPLSLLPGS
jgi:hypothetical protein